MSQTTQYGHSYDEKREAMEWLIEEKRAMRNGTAAERELMSIWRSIAADYRARDRMKVVEVVKRFERALERADIRKKPIYGYEAGNLREIAELTIGSWPAIRQALEDFEK